MPHIKNLASQAAIVAAGVILAGFAMHVLGRFPIVAQAKLGFNGK